MNRDRPVLVIPRLVHIDDFNLSKDTRRFMWSMPDDADIDLLIPLIHRLL